MQKNVTKTIPARIYIILWVVIFLWATPYAAIRISLHSYSPGALALFRFLVASICMALIYVSSEKTVGVKFADIIKAMLIGLVGIGIYNIALNWGELTVTTGIAGFIIGMMPVFTFILAFFWLKEKASDRVWFGVVLSLIGLAFIAWGEREGSHFDWGVCAVLLAAFLGGFYTVFTKSLAQRLNVIEIATFAIWGCTLGLLIFMPQLWQEWQTALPVATWSIVYLGIFPGALGYFAWAYILKYLSAGKTSTALYAMPIIAVILGWLILGEIPAIFALLGGFIALAGAIWVNLTKD